MKTKHMDRSLLTRRVLIIAFVVEVLLLIPLALTLLGQGIDGQGWNWKLGDFIFAAVMLFATGLLLDYVMKKFKTPQQRLLAAGAVLLLFAVLWVEAAVGLFGTPFGGS